MAFGEIADDTPRNRRRIWAVTPYVAFAIAAAAYALIDRTEGAARIAAGVIAGVAAVVALATAYAVYSWQREWAHRPDDELDERQRTSRDSAYRAAYVLVATVGGLALVGSQIAFDVIDDLTVTEIGSGIVLGWFLLTLCLPSSVLLWREEDLEPLGSEA